MHAALTGKVLSCMHAWCIASHSLNSMHILSTTPPLCFLWYSSPRSFHRQKRPHCFPTMHALMAIPLSPLTHTLPSPPLSVAAAPRMLEDAQSFLGRTVIKYFEPVPSLNYPGGNAAGIVADVQVCAHFLAP